MNTIIDRAQKIYQNACAYSKASYLLNAKAFVPPLQDMELGLPSMVNAALALELYFKLLYYLEKGQDFKIKGRYSHDFFCLFEQLSYSTKQEIESTFDERIKNRDMSDAENLEKASSMRIPRDLKTNLSAWKDVFVNIRYIYDSKGKGIPMMFFPEIEQSLLVSIYRLKPEWRH